MASKSNTERLNLDEYDFGNEFDFEEFSMEVKPPKNKREAVERVGAGAWEGAKDTVKSASFFREFVKKALPRGFGDMVDLADQSATSVRELYNEGQKEAKPMFKDVGRMIDKMMPSSSKYLPKSAEKMLKGFADKYRDQPQVGIGANAANDMAVAAMLSETFQYNAKEGARQEAKSDARETIRDVVGNNRHNDNLAQLDGIRRSVVSMAAYQRRIEFNFHKKSLELQARHYYVAVDTLNETRRQNVRNTEMLSGILHNTSLPDLIKMTASEKFKDMLRNKVMGGIQDTVFGARTEFMQNLGKAFREQAIGSISKFAGGVRDGISGMEMAGDTVNMAEDMGMDRYRMGGNAVGGVAAKWLGGLAASKVGKKIMGDNGNKAKALRRTGNRLQHFGSNVPQIANDWSNQYTDAEQSTKDFLDNSRMPDGLKSFLSKVAGVAGNPLIDLFKGTIRRANATDTQVKEKGVADLYAPTQFSNQAHKTIVEVIPGLLARIVQEQQIARTGDTSVDLIQYDYSRGAFSSTKAVRKSVFNKLFDENSRKGVKREQESLMEMVDPAGVLNPQQRAELTKLLMKDNLRGRAGYETGRISNYQNASNFNGSENGEKFAELFRALNEKNKASEFSLNNQFASRFSDVGRSAGSRKKEIQQLLEVYPRDMLEDMGLIKPGSTQIDMEKVYSYFDGEQYNANGAPGIGGVRRTPQVWRGGNRGTPPQLPRPPAANDTANGSTMVDELQKLIAVIELQNSKPLVSDIKDILTAMQADLANMGGSSGPSAFDRAIDGASDLASSAARNARRLKRQALVSGGRLKQQHQAQIDEAKRRAQELSAEAKRRAKRLQRQALVQGGRLRQQYQPQIDGAQEFLTDQQRRAQEAWDGRPSMNELGGMLRNRWDQVRGSAERAQDYVNSDEFRDHLRQRRSQAGQMFTDLSGRARSTAGNIHDRIQQATEQMRQRNESRGLDGEEHKGTLGEIKTILESIRDRLEDGIITTGGVPDGIVRKTKRAVNNGAMRLVDVVKGSAMFAARSVGFGARMIGNTARFGGKAVNTVVGGTARFGWGAIKGTAGLAADGIGLVGGSQYRRARGFVDIYVGNERKPRLYGRMLQEGNVYFDKETGKPIRRLKDIRGDVVRKTAAGEETVLEAAEIEQAWQKVGPVKKSLNALGAVASGAYGLGKGLLGVVTKGIPPVFKMAFSVGKKVWGLLDLAKDVFVKDRLDSPVMTARLMRAGVYYSAASGKVIKSPGKIDGPVLIGDGPNVETVLTHDDLRKGLVDKNGNPIRSGIGKLFNFAMSGIRTAGKLAWKAGKLVNDAGTSLIKNGYALGKKGVSAAVNLAGGSMDVLRGRNPFRQGPSAEITKKAVELQTEQVSYLKEIRDVLMDRLPKRKVRSTLDSDGDGDRDGSYEDQMRNKKEAEEKAAQAKAQAEAGQAGKAGGGLSLWDRLRGKKEEDDEGGDTNIELDGDGRDSKDKRRKRRMARRPGGSWATSQGWKGKAKFVAGKGWSGLKAGGRFAMGIGGGLLGVGSMFAGAGGAIASGAAAVGGALGAGAAAVAGVLASPVVLGGLAVAALGYGAYKLYTRKTLGLLSRIRYVQYGFAPTDKDHLSAVFGLEDKLKDAIIYGKEGAKLDPKRANLMSLFKDFDVDEDDKEAMGNWLQWFGNRFKPVFLTHVAALKSVASDKWLSDVDNLDGPAALNYLNLVRFPEGPYGVTTSPFKDLKSLPSGGGDVKAIVAIAENEFKKKSPGSKAAVAGVAAVGVAGAAAASAKPSGVTPTGVSAKALAGAGVPVKVVPAKGGQVMAAGSSTILESLGTDRLDGVDVVRLKAYGLVKMEADKVRTLKALEKYLTGQLLYNKNVATWSGSVEQVLLDNGAAFGVDSTNDELTANWFSWFNQRFLPVFLNYASLMKAQTGKDDPATGKTLLKSLQAVDVATALFTTNGPAGSVWNVTVPPWDGYAMNADVRSTDANILGLKDMAKAAILVEPGGKGANQPSANKSAANSQPGVIASAASGLMAGVSSMWQKTKSFFGGGPTPQTTGPSPQVGNNPIGEAPGGMVGGVAMVHPGKGTGGDVNSIPMPKGNGSWSALKDTILAASQMAGVDPKLMAAMAAVESGFDYKIPAPTGSATGLYQFVSDTWTWMLKKHGAKYGIAPNASRTDPRANALMGAEYLKTCLNEMQGKLGREVTDTDIYMGHFMGPVTGRKFLQSDPSANASQLFPKEAKSNPNIFFTKDRQPRTIAQVYQLMNNKIRNKAKGMINDGGESMVASKASAPPPAIASNKPAPAAAAAKAAPVGIGAVVATASSTDTQAAKLPGATSSVAAPTGGGMPVGMLASGFMPQSSMQDKMATAKQQNDVRISNLGDTNSLLTQSRDIQQKTFDVMVQIRDNFLKMPQQASVAAPDNSNSTPTSQQSRVAERRTSELPRAPVSVARPRAPG
jgi:hypothetical protein